MRSSSFLAFLVFLIYSNGHLLAQHNQDAGQDSLRIGLVLSGGGAKGIAHVGIIEALEEAGVRVDYITGTSMGALVGAFYAIGYTPAQLREIALSSDFRDLFSERPQRIYASNYEKIFDERTIVSFPFQRRSIALPAGIISGQDIYTYLNRITWNVNHIQSFNEFQIPFAAIGTDLETGKAKVFRSGYLPDVLRASMSIPSFFAPHEIDGRLYVDGGLINNLPVQEAYDMGADFVIAVDVGSKLQTKEQLTSLTSVMDQAIRFRIIDNVNIQKELADYYFEVDGIENYSSSDFGKAGEILELGVQTGKKHLEAFKKIAELQTGQLLQRPNNPPPTPIPVREIIIEGNSIYDDQFFLDLLDFTPGTALDPDIIENNVTRLYSSRYINNVLYRLEPDDDQFVLHLKIEENIENRLGVGMRYEGSSKASLLLNLSIQNPFDTESIARFEARLGERMNVRAEHVYYSLFESRSAFMTSAKYITENVEWYNDGERIALHENETIRGELMWANFFSTNNLLSVGIRKDFTFHRNKINPESIGASADDYHAFFLRYMRDNLNRKSFPERGRKLVIETVASNPLFFSPITFTSSRFYYYGNIAITDFLTFRHGFWLGYTTGRDLPWGYWLTPNRYEPYFDVIRFGGVSQHALNSRNVQMATTGLQAEFSRNWFLGLDVYAGRFMRKWNIDVDRDSPVKAISLSIGNLTLIGPLELRLSHSSLNRFHAEVQVGYMF